MTDNEIIKALECCSNAEPCENCPYQKQCDETDLAEIALDLINRQKAEIERLKGWENLLKAESHAPIIKKAKSEAIKDFAESLEREIHIRPTHSKEQNEYVCFLINNLVKEMVGETNDT